MRTRTHRGLQSRRLAAVAALLAIVAAACTSGSSEIQQYRDPDNLALFEVPNDWHVYDADDLTAAPIVPFATDVGDFLPISNIAAFDAAPGRSLDNLSRSIASVRYPVGSYVVRDVDREERELLNRVTLESLVLRSDVFTVLSRAQESELDLGNRFEGIRRILLFEDTTTQQRGVVLFVSITNPDDSNILAMAVGCSEACFEQFTLDIFEVVESWVVNTKL